MHIARSRMSKAMIAVAVVIVVGIVVDVCRSFDKTNTFTYRLWYRYSAYSKVRNGMTKAEVLKILGKPSRQWPNRAYQTWTYRISPPVNGVDSIRLNLDPKGEVTRVWTLPQMTTPAGLPCAGMTRLEVEKIMGKPDSIYNSECLDVWVYNLWNGVRKPVLFGRNGRKLSITAP